MSWTSPVSLVTLEHTLGKRLRLTDSLQYDQLQIIADCNVHLSLPFYLHRDRQALVKWIQQKHEGNKYSSMWPVKTLSKNDDKIRIKWGQTDYVRRRRSGQAFPKTHASVTLNYVKLCTPSTKIHAKNSWQLHYQFVANTNTRWLS